MQIADGPLEAGLAGTAPPQRSVKPSTRSVGMCIVFLVFCCVRAIHPTVISASRSTLPDGSIGFAYQPAGPVILKNFVVCTCAQLVTIATAGCKGWRDTWQPRPLLIFGVNGALFALDDYLEMASLAKMHGAAYQIINQSKILITALIGIPLKGVYQTRLQWMLLLLLVISMSLYMSILTSGKGSGSDIPMMAYFFTLLKVSVSCLCGVYTDKCAKDYAKTVSLPIQLAQTYFVRVIVALLLSFCSPSIWYNGFFRGWDHLTFAVTISFGIKSSMSFTVLAILDAILKNIAECVAVLLIFFYDVFAPWVDFKFDLQQFLAVLAIIISIGAYVETKEMTKKSTQ